MAFHSQQLQMLPVAGTLLHWHISKTPTEPHPSHPTPQVQSLHSNAAWAHAEVVVHDAGKLRSADCVAEGRVQVVVINKKDFMDLDNPLLAWMLDSDAVTTVLRVSASPPAHSTH